MTLINPDGQSRRVEPNELEKVLLLESRMYAARRCNFDNYLPIWGWAECIARAVAKRGSESAVREWMSRRADVRLIDVAFGDAEPVTALFAGFKIEQCEKET